MQQMYGAVQEAWQAAQRSGEPRLVAARYYRLGSSTDVQGEGYLRDYYSFDGSMVDPVVQSTLTTPHAIKEAIQAYESVGADEVILWPAVPELDQIDRLADAVG